MVSPERRRRAAGLCVLANALSPVPPARHVGRAWTHPPWTALGMGWWGAASRSAGGQDPISLLLTQFLCRCRARLPVNSVTRASQMWLFCFSPVCSTGESCKKSSLPAVLTCQEKGARSPGCASKGLRGVEGSSDTASSASQQLSRQWWAQKPCLAPFWARSSARQHL